VTAARIIVWMIWLKEKTNALCAIKTNFDSDKLRRKLTWPAELILVKLGQDEIQIGSSSHGEQSYAHQCFYGLFVRSVFSNSKGKFIANRMKSNK